MNEQTNSGEAAPEETILLDRRVLESIRGLQIAGEPDFLDELIEIFLEDSAAHMLRLQAADAIGEWGKLRHTAHALKGSAGNLGARRLMTCCERLEQAVTEGHPAAVSGLLDELVECYTQTCAALVKF